MIHETFDCEMLVELVTDWLEGVLAEPTRTDLELHIATCAGCIAYVEQMRATSSALARLDPVEPTEDDRGRLLAIFRARRTPA
jgi:anti-sigma factor RsiW